MLTPLQVSKIATLARLSITEEEAKYYSTNLSSILDYVAQLEKVDVTGVEAMSHVHGANNVFREDLVEPSMNIEAALKNAPDVSGRFIRVPIIIDQGSGH